MLAEMLSEAVALHPDHDAVIHGPRRVSYRQLADDVARCGNGMAAVGLGPGDGVILALPNCIEFVVTYFAAASRGAIVAAVDPWSTDDELSRYIAEGAPRLMVVAAAIADRCRKLAAGLATEVVAVGEAGTAAALSFGEFLAAAPASVTDHPLADADFVHPYSSGTTGTPRRVRRSQVNQVAEASNIVTTAGITSADVIMCAVPLFHALGQYCCMTVAIRAAATVVLFDAGPDQRRQAAFAAECDRLVAVIEENRVTVFPAVPYMFDALAQLAGDQRLSPSLRYCVSGSNFLSEAVFDRFLHRYGLPIRQTYGSSEAGSVAWNCDPEATVAWNTVGPPLRGVSVRILDDHRRALPPGAEGEIAVQSLAVTPGYAAGTAEAAEFHDGHYLTGDLGWLNDRGQLYISGRLRQLIDTGGRKVNAAEVEDVLRRHPNVADAAVVGVPVGAGDTLLTAAIAAVGDVTAAELDAHCRAALADFKVPRRFEMWPDLPRGPMGKPRRDEVLRRVMAPAVVRAPVPPVGIADYLVETLAGLSGVTVPLVGISLAAAGVDSIMAVQLRLALLADFSAPVGIVELFAAPDITALARLVSERIGRAAPTRPESGPVAGEFPLALSQLPIWNACRLAPGGAAYNRSFAARVTGVDLAILRMACQHLVDRHPALRTTFVERDGQPLQRVAGTATVDFAVADLEDLGADGLADRLSVDASAPFELGVDWPFRVRVYTGAHIGTVLLVTTHHIASDFWSLVVLVDELGSAYPVLRRGEPVTAALPPYTFTDYAAWHSRLAQGDAGTGDLAYWRGRLEGLTPAGLPNDRPRQADAESAGTVLFTPLPADLIAQLRVVAKACGGTLFSVLLTAFQVMVGRYAASADVAVAVTSTARIRPEFRDIVGQFVNPLVIRTDISGTASFRALAAQVQQSLHAALDHQSAPFCLIVDDLRPRREAGRAPLVDVLFAHNRAHRRVLDRITALLGGAIGERLTIGELTLESIPLAQTAVVYDLTALVYESDDHVSIGWEYSTDLFDPSTALAFARAFHTLLDTVVRADPAPTQLSILGTAERRYLLEQSIGPVADNVPLTHVQIAASASRHGDRCAVAAPDGDLTYREFDRRARHVAASLCALGVTTEARIAVCLPRSTNWLVAAVGVLYAGGAFVPVDPGWPDDRIRVVLADARVAAMLVTEPLRQRLERLRDCPTVSLSTLPAGEPARLAEPAVGPKSLAYVMYTSGSTGRPKGVLIEHGGLANYLAWSAREYGLDQGAPLYTPLTFDLAITSALGPLVAGGTVRLVPDADGTDLRALLEGDRPAAMIKATPTHLQLMRRLAPPEAWAARAATLVVGGELLSREVAGPWLPFCRLVNEYGPTEATVASSAGDVTDSLFPGKAVAPIGRPIAGATQFVLDATMEPAATGVTGEIYIGGAGVARGYADQPRLTAERFVPDPFGPPGARLYRTGDIGRYLSSGSVVVLGRADDEVKVRGYRVDPAEVELTLLGLPEVVGAAVTAIGTHESRRLAAHVVLAGAEQLSDADLRERLRPLLPEHLIPAVFVRVPSLPQMPSGKVDRAALVVPEDRAETPPHAPASETESILAAAWAEVLRVPAIDLDADFFSLGGDSISNILICAQANRAGVTITPRDLLRHPTVRELARVARRADPALAREPSHGAAPLAPIQRWFFDLDLADAHHWNQSLILRPKRWLAASHLDAALAALGTHHGALRFRFHRDDGEWVQTRSPLTNAFAFHHDVLPADDDGWPERFAATQAGLNLADGPIAAAHLIEQAGGEQLLLLTVHHLVVDIVSWHTLLDDLASAYDQIERGTPVVLPAASTSFADWTHAVAEWAGSPEAAEEADHWIGLTDSPGRSTEPGRGHELGRATTVSAGLSEAETVALVRRLPAAAVRDLVVAATVGWLRGVNGAARPVVMLEGNGRSGLCPDLDVSRTIGWFTSLFPLLLDLDDPATVATPYEAVRDALALVPRDGAGFGALRYFGAPPVREALDRLARGALASVQYLGQFDQIAASNPLFTLHDTETGSERSPRSRLPTPIEVTAMIRGGRLVVRVTYIPGRIHADLSGAAAAIAAGIAKLAPATASATTPATAPATTPATTPAKAPDAWTDGRYDFGLSANDVRQLEELIARPGPATSGQRESEGDR